MSQAGLRRALCVLLAAVIAACSAVVPVPPEVDEPTEVVETAPRTETQAGAPDRQEQIRARLMSAVRLRPCKWDTKTRTKPLSTVATAGELDFDIALFRRAVSRATHETGTDWVVFLKRETLHYFELTLADGTTLTLRHWNNALSEFEILGSPGTWATDELDWADLQLEMYRCWMTESGDLGLWDEHHAALEEMRAQLRVALDALRSGDVNPAIAWLDPNMGVTPIPGVALVTADQARAFLLAEARDRRWVSLETQAHVTHCMPFMLGTVFVDIRVDGLVEPGKEPSGDVAPHPRRLRTRWRKEGDRWFVEQIVLE